MLLKSTPAKAPELALVTKRCPSTRTKVRCDPKLRRSTNSKPLPPKLLDSALFSPLLPTEGNLASTDSMSSELLFCRSAALTTVIGLALAASGLPLIREPVTTTSESCASSTVDAVACAQAAGGAPASPHHIMTTHTTFNRTLRCIAIPPKIVI